jgi:hypothetical protein
MCCDLSHVEELCNENPLVEGTSEVHEEKAPVAAANDIILTSLHSAL